MLHQYCRRRVFWLVLGTSWSMSWDYDQKCRRYFCYFMCVRASYERFLRGSPALENYVIVAPKKKFDLKTFVNRHFPHSPLFPPLCTWIVLFFWKENPNEISSLEPPSNSTLLMRRKGAENSCDKKKEKEKRSEEAKMVKPLTVQGKKPLVVMLLFCVRWCCCSAFQHVQHNTT